MKSLKYIILFIAEAITSFYTPLAVETIIHSMKYISVVNSGFMNQLKLFSNKFTQLVEIRCYNLSVFHYGIENKQYYTTMVQESIVYC